MGAEGAEGLVMRDPVCGMQVEAETAAAAWDHEGTTYYFCSVGCFENFKQDPDHYLGLNDSQRHM